MKTVEDVINELPAWERPIVKKLRSLVLECLPFATEKLSYGVPYYTRHRMICFIWPPSIVWEKPNPSRDAKGVTLGFCQGNRFANDEGLLLAEGRKQVYCMYFRNLREIHDDDIRALLFEAEIIDGTFKKAKRKS